VKLDLLENSIQQMARIVQKFGGTSVADLDRIRNVAQRVKTEVDAGHEVAVVVSAMSGQQISLSRGHRRSARFMMRANMIRLLRLANR
jgi:aspartokinase